MVWLGEGLVLLHILSAFALIAGLIGREFARAYARRQSKLDIFVHIISLSGWFESRLVIPGSNALLLLGFAAAWARGWPLFGVLQGSPINWLFVSLLLFLSLIPIIAFIFVPRGKIFAQELAAAETLGTMTPGVRAAMDDPVVFAAHIYEWIVVAVVIGLMVLKPF